MESLNKSLYEYGKLLKETNIQEAYKELIQYISELRRWFTEKHPEYDVSASLYQGYLDLTFFSLTTELAMQKDLKYMVVFKHEDMQFEVWLSGRNRGIMSKYSEKFSAYSIGHYVLNADQKGMSAIIEATLVKEPDFDDLPILTKQIDSGVMEFIREIETQYLDKFEGQ